MKLFEFSILLISPQTQLTLNLPIMTTDINSAEAVNIYGLFSSGEKVVWYE